MSNTQAGSPRCTPLGGDSQVSPIPRLWLCGLLMLAMPSCRSGGEASHTHEGDASHAEAGHEQAKEDGHSHSASALTQASTPKPGGAPHDDHGLAPQPGGGARALTLDADALRDLRITTAISQARPEQVPVTAMGELQVDETRYAEVGAAISGRVVRLIASAGEGVRIGQPLAELESPHVGQARADLLQAQAQHALAVKVLERKTALLAGGIVSPRELEEAETALTAAKATVLAAQAALAPLGGNTQAEGGRFFLTSPLSGKILSRSIHLGELLGPEKTAFRVADLSRLWVVASVFERDAVHLTLGGPAHILPAALPGQRLEAKVTQIGAEVQPSSRSVQVRLELENPSGLLKPGMSATVQILQVQLLPVQGVAPAVVTVPLAAVQRVEDHWVVFVPRGTGRFEMRTIGRGRDLGGEVEVLSGLEAGTELVVEGSFVLRASATQGQGGDEHHH